MDDIRVSSSGSHEEHGQRPRELATPVSCLIGAGLWWFLSAPPSSAALILAGSVLAYLWLGFCYLALTLPGPESPSEPAHPGGKPSGSERRKVSTA